MQVLQSGMLQFDSCWYIRVTVTALKLVTTKTQKSAPESQPAALAKVLFKAHVLHEKCCVSE